MLVLAAALTDMVRAAAMRVRRAGFCRRLAPLQVAQTCLAVHQRLGQWNAGLCLSGRCLRSLDLRLAAPCLGQVPGAVLMPCSRQPCAQAARQQRQLCTLAVFLQAFQPLQLQATAPQPAQLTGAAGNALSLLQAWLQVHRARTRLPGREFEDDRGLRQAPCSRSQML